MSLPAINQRLKDVIQNKANGSATEFAELCKLNSPDRLLRLFRPNPQTNKFPAPSVETIVKISKTFPDVDLNWLLTGKLNENTVIVENEINLEHEAVLNSLKDFVVRVVKDEIKRNK